MNINYKKALLNTAGISYGISASSLIWVSVQEALHRCKNMGFKSQIARATKTFKKLLGSFPTKQIKKKYQIKNTIVKKEMINYIIIKTNNLIVRMLLKGNRPYENFNIRRQRTKNKYI